MKKRYSGDYSLIITEDYITILFKTHHFEEIICLNSEVKLPLMVITCDLGGDYQWTVIPR